MTSAVLVIIPAFNEQATIAQVVRAVRSQLPSADVLVIDDGSRDRTAQQAREAGALVSVLPYNLGVGGALRVGYRYAWRWGLGCVKDVGHSCWLCRGCGGGCQVG